MNSFKKYNLVSKVKGSTYTIPFHFPGVGDTGQSLTIVNQYSQEFREAESESNRQISQLLIANEGKELDKSVVRDIQRRTLAALVVSWTFDEECNVDNVSEFLKENPRMEDEINKVAANDTLFFKKEENS